MRGRAGVGIYRDAEKPASLMISLTIGIRVFCSNRFDAIREIPWRAMVAIFASGVANAFDIVRVTTHARDMRHSVDAAGA